MSPGADLHGTFRAARERISHHMDAFERRGDRWKEETVTDLLLELCAPTVEFRTFTKSDEGELGADWLWWWVDGSGEAFGMLVQAKRLKDDGRAIDFEYARKRHPKGDQRERLIDTAARLGLPAMYAVYLGTTAYRAGRYCQFELVHHDPCFYCEPATISMVTALLTFVAPGRPQPKAALENSVPLEWMVDPEFPAPRVRHEWDNVSDDLREFISQPQHGARRIAQWVFVRTAEIGATELKHAAAEPMIAPESLEERVFSTMPQDTGPFDVPYFEATLGGLQRRPPSYVRRILDGEDVFDAPAPGIEGVAVVRLDE